MGSRKKGSQNNNYNYNAIAAGLLFLIFLFVCLKFLVSNPTIFIILILLAVAVVVYIVYRKVSLKKSNEEAYYRELANQTVSDVKVRFLSHPQEFENYVADLFRFKGFEVEVTPQSRDGGKDLILYKDQIKYVAEVKLYGTNDKIGRPQLQKLQGAMLDSHASHAIFVTTSSYTKDAIEYAIRNNITLVDEGKLAEMIQSRKAYIRSCLDI